MVLHLIIPLFLLATAAYSQPDSLWGRTYGFDEFGAEHIGRVIQTEDGGFMLAGYYRRHEPSRNDIYVVRTDDIGDTLWTRFYGGDGRDECYDVIETESGDYIIAGKIDSYGQMLRIDSQGEIIWNQVIEDASYLLEIITITDGRYALVGTGGNAWDGIFLVINEDGEEIFSDSYGGDGAESCRAIVQTDDEGYLLGMASNSFGNGGFDAYLVKLDAEYEMEWTNTYGGDNDDGCFDIIQTLDGGYALAGYTESFSERGDEDYWVIKIDENGEEQWSQVYGEGLDDKCYNIVQLENGDFILAGNTYLVAPYQCGIMRVNRTGDLIWEANYWELCRTCNSLILTDDGGYMLGGSISYGSDFFLLKLSTDMVAWVPLPDSSFMENTVLSCPTTYFLDYLIPDVYRDSVLTFSVIDGEHISGDFTEDSLFITPLEDWFGLDSLLLTVAEADSETNCDTTWLRLTVTENTLAPYPDESEIPLKYALTPCYPNPFNASTTIAYQLPEACDVSLKIFDVQGREIETLIDRQVTAGFHRLVWDGNALPTGLYICRMEAEDYSRSIKLVLVR